MDRRWRKGDVVKVIGYHPWVSQAKGMIFTVERFSTMDGMEHHPIIKNPWREHGAGVSGGPLNLRFEPDWLVEASVLERLSSV